MRAVLSAMDCRPVFSKEIQPLKYCYSVNITSIEAPNHIYANGKGSETKAATASGLGEYIERLQTNNFFSDFYLPKRQFYPDEARFEFGQNYLSPELLHFYDPEGHLVANDLVDFNTDREDITCLPFISQTSDETIYFPVNILNNLYVSNGLASGNSPKEAQVQALSEILERYVKMEIIKKGYSLPEIPAAIIHTLKLRHDISELEQRGFIIKVLDASLGGTFPVTAISLIHPENGGIFVSFGAHPILEVALERTMTELMQGRGIDTLNIFDPPTFDMDEVASSYNLEAHFIDSNGKVSFAFLGALKDFSYTPWNYAGQGCADEYLFLSDIISRMHKDIYLREYTFLDFYSCQILVPGVSEIYPASDLLYSNRNMGKWLRPMVLFFQKYPPQKIIEMVEDLDDNLNMEHYIGVIFKEPFTMLEFKAQLFLLQKDEESALAFLSFSEKPLPRVLAELLQMTAHGLQFQDHADGMYAVFGHELVQRGCRILELEEYLIDVTLHDQYHEMLNLYDRLAVKKENISGTSA